MEPAWNLETSESRDGQVKKKEKVEDYDHLTDTGDYILSENVRNIRIPISHPTNEPSETELYSDHMPVIASVII